MRPGGHKRGHSQIGESAHAHPYPLGGVIAIRRTFPKFSGADDMLLGTAAAFQERMAYIAKTIPNGNGKLLLLPGLGHVPHLEAPEKVLPPLVEFLKAGLTAVK